VAKGKKEWDVFISHASEDKDDFVRPLAEALRSLGVSVWYDEFSLRLGDSLRESIDKGIAHSRRGVVMLSRAFFAKRWPQEELNGLWAREVEEGSIILPVWLDVTKADVTAVSPMLANRVAVKTVGLDAEDVALQLLAEIRPDLYAKHPQAELEKILSGEATRELQEELERVRGELEGLEEELSEYRCPYCGSGLAMRTEVVIDDRGDTDSYETFQCGYENVGGSMRRPCPKDPHFPAFADFELKTSEREDAGDQFRWTCYAQPKTFMATHLHLSPGSGETCEEAENRVRENYDRARRRA
jgi:predicted RNA-binding Zn-ribbon protein involved in translation (DUF1610 family)